MQYGARCARTTLEPRPWTDTPRGPPGLAGARFSRTNFRCDRRRRWALRAPGLLYGVALYWTNGASPARPNPGRRDGTWDWS
eukprot:scaffold24260_cov126-Isochrysis_galbana.AAC.1